MKGSSFFLFHICPIWIRWFGIKNVNIWNYVDKNDYKLNNSLFIFTIVLIIIENLRSLEKKCTNQFFCTGWANHISNVMPSNLFFITIFLSYQIVWRERQIVLKIIFTLNILLIIKHYPYGHKNRWKIDTY